jgi:hypothetical protein
VVTRQPVLPSKGVYLVDAQVTISNASGNCDVGVGPLVRYSGSFTHQYGEPGPVSGPQVGAIATFSFAGVVATAKRARLSIGCTTTTGSVVGPIGAVRWWVVRLG